MHEAQRLHRLGQQTKVQHAALWAECLRLADTSATGSPKAKRARMESLVDVDMDESEVGSDLPEGDLADVDLADGELADGDLSDLSDDGLADADLAGAQPEAEQELGEQLDRMYGSIFVAAADGEE